MFQKEAVLVSIKDIAQICHVSPATVSKALNDHSDISEKTKKRIQAVAKELGYMPNSAARALKTQRTHNIGVLFVDAANSGLTHHYFAHVLESFKVKAEMEGYDITFINNRRQDSNMTYYEHCLYRGVDGVVIACVDFEETQVRELINSALPVVTIDHTFNNCSAVVSDNITGMKDIVNYVVDKGHKRIAFIHGENESSVTKERLSSFYRTLLERSIVIPENYVREGKYLDSESASMHTKELLRLAEPPTCIIYQDDLSCIGGINRIRKDGLEIPRDVSVVGYDGQQIAEIIRPRLTTLHQDTKVLGEKAAELLVNQIENPRSTIVQRIVVKGSLIEGQTVNHIKNAT